MKPNEQKILDLLSNHDVTFFIPPFQRNYEWTPEQCRILWDDMVNTSRRNIDGQRSEHFFGAITYYKTDTSFGEPDVLVLVDGQQRITTTMLFLAALRDVCGDRKKADLIDSRYLKNQNATGEQDEYKVKLKQVETDWPAYRKLILGDEMSESEQATSVYVNYLYFKEKLLEWKKSGENPFALLNKGLLLFSVITIELKPTENPWENPQEIFESMNSIGKPLSLADLVRNYLLFGEKPKRQEDFYKKYWLVMERSVPLRVSTYIRDFMQFRGKCSFPVTSEANHKRLYQEFKKLFAGIPAESLLKELSEHSKTYGLIVGAESGEKQIDALLADFRQLGVTTSYSFLLALLVEWRSARLSTDGLVSLLSAFRTYCVRRRVVKLVAGENRLFPRLVQFIPDLVAADDRGSAMFARLSQTEFATRLPNDIELANTLEAMSNFYSLKYCKFCLALVEESLTKHRPDIENDDLLQIEHIMPQTLNAKWRAELGQEGVDVHPQIVHSIGNLTLIRHNQELGNRPFAEKKEIYENHAGLQIAREKIVDKGKWDASAIAERAKWLISFVVEKVLPIPQQLRTANNYSVRKQMKAKGLSFKDLGLIGEEITFIDDDAITARVVSDTEVEFEGKVTKLSPLTREIKIRQGRCNQSGSYQGAQYWKYEDIRLAELM